MPFPERVLVLLSRFGALVENFLPPFLIDPVHGTGAYHLLFQILLWKYAIVRYILILHYFCERKSHVETLSVWPRVSLALQQTSFFPSQMQTVQGGDMFISQISMFCLNSGGKNSSLQNISALNSYINLYFTYHHLLYVYSCEFCNNN